MNTTISRRVLVLAASLIGIAWTGPARADSFKFPLAGEQCVPPVATSGTGEVELTYDPATRVVTWNIPYGGLSSAVTLAHFPGRTGHRARKSDKRASHADARAGTAIRSGRMVRERAHAIPSRVRAARSGGPSQGLIASAFGLHFFHRRLIVCVETGARAPTVSDQSYTDSNDQRAYQGPQGLRRQAQSWQSVGPDLGFQDS